MWPSISTRRMTRTHGFLAINTECSYSCLLSDCPCYWFASERRGAKEQFLFGHACWLGAITVATIYGIHIALQRANAMTPATLATDQLSTILLIFICGLGWWIASFLRHFRRD